MAPVRDTDMVEIDELPALPAGKEQDANRYQGEGETNRNDGALA
jgi:hypothetical protein